jgi:hypothetical protein
MRKNNRTIIRLLILSLILVMAVSACGGNQTEDAEDPNAAVTHVVETAMAAITQTAAVQSPTPSSTPTTLPTSTNTPEPSLEPSPTLPSLPSATSVFNQPTTPNSSCDIGTFVKDVTIPDGTAIAAGEKFTKTWEIENSGTCTWNENYQLIFYGGERMAEDTAYSFTDEDIEPGESVQISLEMTAPSTNGTYYSYWIFRNDAGQNFFVDGGSIYAQISVGGTATPGPTATLDTNTAPTVTINTPVPAPPYDTTTSITFSGTANDNEDGGDFTNEITWTSSIDGFLGTGKSINATLSEGTHTIKAEVKDSNGVTGFSTIQITVSAAP